MHLDITPFAQRIEDAGTLTFRWEEPRDIARLELTFDALAPVVLPVEYWQNVWPEQRATEADLAAGAIGAVGWRRLDDWFNGQWRRADIETAAESSVLIVTFAPLNRQEFPELADYPVRFRQANQLRLRLPTGAGLRHLAILTTSELATREMTVEVGVGERSEESEIPRSAREDQEDRGGAVTVYNGVLQEVAEDAGRLRLRVACTNPWPLSHDHTIVTVRAGGRPFSFRPADLDRGPIYIPACRALVADAAADLRWSPELAATLTTGESTYDRIPREPEQTLARALREQPPKEPMHFILGCEGARQKFGLAPNGDLFAVVGFVRSVPAGDTPRVGWPGHGFALRFGWDDWLPTGRRLAEGYLPVHEARFSRGAVDVLQESIALPILGGMGTGPGDQAIAALLRLTFTNNGTEPWTIRQPLDAMTYEREGPQGICRHQGEARRETLEWAQEGSEIPRGARDDNAELWVGGVQPYLRLVVDTHGRGELLEGETLCYQVDLRPGESHAITLKVPFLGLLTAEERAALAAKTFEAERAVVETWWRARLAEGQQIETPCPDVTDFAKSHLMHVLVNDDREVGSECIMGRVSSFNYGNYSNEAIMQIMDLDRRGLHEEARRHLATYLKYQGTVGLPGNFQGRQGLFYGSGGYEHGGYNQHHGWVLWGMAEHYRLSGDAEWLRAVGDQVAAGCDWVVRERQATMRTDAAGNRVLEYGFLPAGALEDVTDYCYWLSTNALTSRGLTAAADALAAVGHTSGPRLVAEAAAYREDLLAGFREQMARSPVMRLRNGAYVPHHPSRLYRRGRDFGWIREVLEGSINLIGSLLDPGSDEATWILQDYEDNRYLDAPYNYPLDHPGQWFSRGGFSMQPNLLYFPPPYLYRDQVEHFLRAFWNGFAACWRADIRAMTEHPLPTLADWTGDHFKSSDESMVMMWLRQMFIQEVGDTLYLGRGLPRAWLADPAGVAITNAATYFGPMSLRLRAEEGGRRMVAEVEPPTRRPPAEVVLRFRHPERWRLVGGTVNGQPVARVDAEKEWLVLEPPAGPVTVIAEFGPS